MEIWFGIGDHEVQMDLRGSGLALSMPKPGVLQSNFGPVQPSGESEDSWDFDLTPQDHGEFFGSYRSWEYQATFLWENPETQETVACELRLSLCRENQSIWGLCIYPEGSSGTVVVLPEEVAQSLENSYSSLPPEGWTKTPYVIQGGLHEEG